MDRQFNKSYRQIVMSGLGTHLSLVNISKKNYNEVTTMWYFFEVDLKYPEKLLELRNDFPFLPERMMTEMINKLVRSLNDRKGYVNLRILKQTFNQGTILQKVHKIIKFNQKDWLKSYIDMNKELRKTAKNYFKKGFF